MITKLYLISKKVHRLLVIMMLVMGTIMGLTGVIMKYPSVLRFFPFVDLGLNRYLHNNLSIIFVMGLGCMIITGTYMYLFPTIRRITHVQKPSVGGELQQ